MQTLTPIDAGHVVNMVLRENRGNILSEALCVGIERAVIFYCEKLQAGAEQGVKLMDQQKGP